MTSFVWVSCFFSFFFNDYLNKSQHSCILFTKYKFLYVITAKFNLNSTSKWNNTTTFKARDLTFGKWSIYYKNSTFDCVEILYCFKRLLKGRGKKWTERENRSNLSVHQETYNRLFSIEKSKSENDPKCTTMSHLHFLKDLDWMPIWHWCVLQITFT